VVNHFQQLQPTFGLLKIWEILPSNIQQLGILVVALIVGFRKAKI
jgi:hypothetical protein